MDRSYKSTTAGGEDRAVDVAKTWVPFALANFPRKFWWFASRPEPDTPPPYPPRHPFARGAGVPGGARTPARAERLGTASR